METIFNFNKVVPQLKTPKLKRSTVLRYIYWLIKGNTPSYFEISQEFKERLYEETKKRAESDLEALKKHLGV